MKNLSKAVILAALSTMTIIGVSAAELGEVDLNEAANNIDMEGIKVNDYESGDVEIGDSKVNASEGTVENDDQKVDAEAGRVEQDGKVYQGPGTEMEGVEKLDKVKMEGEGDANGEKVNVENEPDLNAAPNEENAGGIRDENLPDALPKTGAEEIVILLMAMILAGLLFMKDRKTS